MNNNEEQIIDLKDGTVINLDECSDRNFFNTLRSFDMVTQFNYDKAMRYLNGSRSSNQKNSNPSERQETT